MQTRRLPLYVALAGLVLYVCTLGGRVTLTGLPLASTLAGWNDMPMVGQPLLWLVTLPLEVLPAAWMPLAVQLWAAVLAAAVLGLLARTVQLLPWDRPWNNVTKLAGALPVLTAVTVCGLEFSFWQQATSTCGDLLDLLLLAAALWLLLEYNARRDSHWLDAAAVVWGLGMAENSVMLLALPLFVIAVIWLERFRLFGAFNWQFLLRLAGLGMAGFSVYAVLPLANGWLPHSPWTLGQAWIASLHQTKTAVLLPYKLWRANRFVTIAVAICFLVPTLPLLVRMRDEDTHTKSGVDRLQLWLYRGLRAGLLLACCWLAFDPPPGARQAIHKLGLRLPLLTFDYLNALGAAFLMGNLLLISQLVVKAAYPLPRIRITWRRMAVPLATAGFGLVVLGLVGRNLPALWQMNHHPLEQFGELAVKSLPAGRGVMLSDNPEKLLIFEAALSRRHGATDWLAVETRALPTVRYRARLEQRLPAGWLTDQTRHELTPLETLQLLEQVARTNRLFYLHPGLGQFFEGFYLEPTGTIYELKRRGKDPLAVPPLPGATLDASEQFWTRLWDQELAAEVPPASRVSGWAKKLARYGLLPAPREENRLLGEWNSIPLEGWGVTLQKQGRWREAKVRFQQALKLNTNDMSARISLTCNTNLQAGNQVALPGVKQVADQLGNLDRMNLLMELGGPFDEPTVCFVLGLVCSDHGWPVQAAEQLERVRSLTSGALPAELKLAEIYNQMRMPDRSRPLIIHMRETLRKAPAQNSTDQDTLDMDLALLESNSWLMQDNRSKARDALKAVATEHPDDPQVVSRAVSAYLDLGDLPDAWLLAEARLAKSPDDVPSLNAKARILRQTSQPSEAIPLLDHVLALTNDPVARLERAFARIDTQDFASAKSDLDELEKSEPASGMMDYGLALVAAQGNDTNSARHYFQVCLSNTPAGGPLWQQASARLQTLEPVK